MFILLGSTKENSMTSAPSVQAPFRTPATEGPAPGRLVIRDAQPADMAQVQRIYAHHVLCGTATFEETPPTVEEMQARRKKVVDLGMPYLLAELDDNVVGYCYAAPYRPR